MKLNIQKIKKVLIEDHEGKLLEILEPGMFGLDTMNDKTQVLRIRKAKPSENGE